MFTCSRLQRMCCHLKPWYAVVRSRSSSQSSVSDDEFCPRAPVPLEGLHEYFMFTPLPSNSDSQDVRQQGATMLTITSSAATLVVNSACTVHFVYESSLPLHLFSASSNFSVSQFPSLRPRRPIAVGVHFDPPSTGRHCMNWAVSLLRFTLVWISIRAARDTCCSRSVCLANRYCIHKFIGLRHPLHDSAFTAPSRGCSVECAGDGGCTFAALLFT